MMTKARNPEGVARALTGAADIALLCHVTPDGDAIGSTLAVANGLRVLGKQVTCVCADPVPEYLNFLPGAEMFILPEECAGKMFDLVMSIDCGDEKRIGRAASLLKQTEHTAQIDHHRSNTFYMQVNDVDEDAPAAAMLAAEQLKLLGVTLTPDIASCLYTALVTDTGSFAFDSVNAATFRLMAELMEAGLPLTEVNRRIYRERGIGQLMLLKKALGSLEVRHGGKITLMMVSQADMAEAGAKPEDTDGIVNYALDIKGVKMTMMLRETPEGAVKVSLRSLKGYDVGCIAQRHGGGGHTQAAGCTIFGMALREAAEMLAAEMEKLLDEVGE